MQEVLRTFRDLLKVTPGRLERISEADSASCPGPGRWSRKEIVGHLVDSAANNHQRFVRTQAEPELSFPGYAQELWVSTQRYQRESWRTLCDLWRSYNFHLLHIMEQVPEEKLGNRCRVGDAEPVTLKILMTDYVRHLGRHLRQILGE